MALEAIADAGIQGARPGRDRDHQPARDRGRLGPGHRRARPSRTRLAGPAHGGALRPAEGGGARGHWCASAPGSSSTRTSRARRSSGSWRTSRRRAGRRSGRSTPGSSSSSPAATSPTTRTPRGRCCSTSAGLRWDPELCDLLGVDPSSLPEPVPSAQVYGRTGVFGGDVPVAGIAGDQQAALFGQACQRAGMAKNTYGTGSFVLLNTGGEAPEPGEGLLTTVAWGLGGQDRLRARGGGVHHRRRGAVAPRRPRDHRLGVRERGARGLARLERRGLLRARADRPGIAALGPVCARDDRRPDARLRPRAAGARRPRGDRLPDRGRGAGPGGGRRGGGSRC